MNKLIILPEAWEDYLYWQTQDKKTLKKINNLIKDIDRNGYSGIGKPEPLIGDLSGWWSRRIDETNRIIYRISNGNIEISQCKGHYNDR
jgi:toxin YoeB